MHVEQEVLHFEFGQCVEGAEWFVKEKHARIASERAGEGGALRHAAGDLARTMLGETGQADKFEQLCHPVVADCP